MLWLQVMLELMVEAPPCSLDDFLPSPWKAIHYKYRKVATQCDVSKAACAGCGSTGWPNGRSLPQLARSPYAFVLP